MDQFFTPSTMARSLIDGVTRSRVRSIADFAAGDGALLLAALERWPKVSVFASDLCGRQVRRLHRLLSSGVIRKCDFLNPVSRQRSIQSGLRFDLILLNPPFSVRGMRTWEVSVGGITLRASKALAFVVHASTYLTKNGELLCVLPRGTLRSLRDAAAWQWLKERFDVQVLADTKRGDFEMVAAHAVLVRILRQSRKEQSATIICKTASHAPPVIVELIRGCNAVFRSDFVSNGKFHFIHTTNLQDGHVIFGDRYLNDATRVVTGPAVLLPRIGKPDQRKICLLTSKKAVVLSDCVYAIKTRNLVVSRALRRDLLNNWDRLRDSFGGTCAPYLTCDGLAKILDELGYQQK